MAGQEKYGVLIFRGYGPEAYSFSGDEGLCRAMAKGMPGQGGEPMYMAVGLSAKGLDGAAGSASAVVERINAGRKFDALKELRKYHKGWDSIVKPG